MSKWLLSTESRVGPLYWGGDGWWTRRKDQAKRFASREEAEKEREASITVRIETSDAEVTAET